MVSSVKNELRLPVEIAVEGVQGLLIAGGMASNHAQSVAAVLVESDLLGHRTHGLAQLPGYLDRLRDGIISSAGVVEVEMDHGAAFLWRAQRLPGAWVLHRAIEQALDRISLHPVVTISIADCSHIGALQAYLEALGRRGLLALMMVTSPAIASVAPFGGRDAVLTSNPIAACIPTEGDPVLIDQSTSVVSNGALASYSGGRLPGQWLLDAQGRLSDDPADAASGTILPLGGEEFGFKGFALGLIVEAFALALSGHARNVPSVPGSQGVFLQLIDPGKFAGREAFLAGTTDLVQRCKGSRPVPGRSIRLPGERALACKSEQLVQGIVVDKAVVAAIDHWSEQLQTPWRPSA